MGSVITKKIHMDILASVLPLCWHLHDTNMRETAARFFGAFKKAIEKLEKYYRCELPAIDARRIQYFHTSATTSRWRTTSPFTSSIRTSPYQTSCFSLPKLTMAAKNASNLPEGIQRTCTFPVLSMGMPHSCVALKHFQGNGIW